VEVLVSNRVVARGEVVVVSGSYGIRILDVVSQRERVRSMEA
jgi:flagellar motor switch protein FliN/FliY